MKWDVGLDGYRLYENGRRIATFVVDAEDPAGESKAIARARLAAAAPKIVQAILEGRTDDAEALARDAMLR